MGRGKYYTWWRRFGESLEASLYADGWAARAAYSLGLQGRLSVDAQDFALPFKLPLREPLRIAFASDIHAGPLTDPRLLDRVLGVIADFSPHVLLLGGDFVSLHHRHVKTFTGKLRELSFPAGVFGIFGNHDLWVDNEFLHDHLRNVGVRMLVNESIALPDPFGEIWLCGLDEPGTGNPDPVRTFDGAGDRRILLMHSPLGMKLVRDIPFDLAFCGHTHGGQIAFPWGRPIILPTGSGDRKHSNGSFVLSDGRRLTTSRGIGMSDVPIRLFSPSEVHLYTIRGLPQAIQLT